VQIGRITSLKPAVRERLFRPKDEPKRRARLAYIALSYLSGEEWCDATDGDAAVCSLRPVRRDL
jgi:hypothetical protein